MVLPSRRRATRPDSRVSRGPSRPWANRRNSGRLRAAGMARRSDSSPGSAMRFRGLVAERYVDTRERTRGSRRRQHQRGAEGIGKGAFGIQRFRILGVIGDQQQRLAVHHHVGHGLEQARRRNSHRTRTAHSTRASRRLRCSNNRQPRYAPSLKTGSAKSRESRAPAPGKARDNSRRRRPRMKIRS